MKKSVKGLVLVLLVLSMMFSSVAFASGEIKVSIDEEYVDFDVNPQIVNGRTMVPFRAIFEALGAEVDWENDTRTAIGIKNDKVVRAQINNKTMYVDDVAKAMDIAPMIVGGRTFVPARFIAEAFGCKVDWDNTNREVIIKSSLNINKILTEKEAVYIVQNRVKKELVAEAEYSFTHNNKAYYQVAIKEKKYYDIDSDAYYMSRITSYIISKDGTELFEGFYNKEQRTLINYELIEEE